MFLLSNLLAHLLVGFLVLLAPWLSARRYQALKRDVASGVAGARLRFYRRALRGQTTLLLAVAVICLLGSIPAAEIGLRVPGSYWILFTAAILLGFALSIPTFRRRGDAQLRRLLRAAGALLPRSLTERRWFMAVGLGAGISEEVIFRGFLFYYLQTIFPDAGAWQLALISSAVFSYCHLYQGWFGMLTSGLIGLCLAGLYVMSSTIIVPMAVHAAIDMRLPLILTAERIRSLTASEEATS